MTRLLLFVLLDVNADENRSVNWPVMSTTLQNPADM